ncbi:MAG: serine/threonine protein kinase, partial [Monoglobaceae bacterium]
MSLCMGCMNEKGSEAVCPYCGLDEEMLSEAATTFLPPGYVLKERYTIGIALGQGGFGITYIGYDDVLGTKVAIKEYYPSDIAQRTVGDKT